MDYLFLPAWPLQLNETMHIAVALLFAGLAGEGLARAAKLPRVSGYSLAGLLLGPSVWGWFGIEDVQAFRILIDLTLALLLFELGIRVDLRWFRKNPWLLASSIAEASLTFATTFAALHLMGSSAGFAATVAAIAMGTSPAVVMRVAAELRAEGQVTQRLFVHTALNILYSVVLSKLIVGGMHGAFRSDWNAAVLHPLYLLSGSLLMACKARSLLTQILIANLDKVTRLLPASGPVIAGQSVVLTLELDKVNQTAAEPRGDTLSGAAIPLPNRVGLHARPAAVLATEAKKYKADIRLVRGADEANAKSVVAIMGLATQCHDLLSIKACGPDAAIAVHAMTALLAAGCGEKSGEAPSTPVIRERRAIAASPDDLVGVSASPNLAVGRVAQYRQPMIEVAETGETPDSECSRLKAALLEARAQIEKLKRRLVDPAKAQILGAQQELLEDPELMNLAIDGVSHGQSAGFAWRSAFSQQASRLEALTGLNNALLRERGSDIRDVGQRVLALLAGVKPSPIKVPAGSILIAEDLSPSDTASLDRSMVIGFCTTRGGATSHVAILARSLGIPAVCGIDQNVLTLEDGQLVVLDGSRGLLHRNPSQAEIDDAHERVARQTARDSQDKARANVPAVTADGHHIAVLANVRNAQEAHAGVANGAAGVGLLRSEFLFDQRDSAPGEDEQAAAYSAVAEALGRDNTLIVRTLDVGGDKPLRYLPLPHEDNPFLGLRGVRVSLEQPAMFRTQLRAILRTAARVKLHIMLPMIATLEEWREAKAILAEEQAAAGYPDVRLGMMVEVPSAAVMAEQFAREADFFSIGTNDLTQYTLAMDRGHPKLAPKADGLHPSVLRMIALTCEGARQHDKWVGVCGGMASEVMAVPLLIGLGVDELSVSVPAIPAIKALIRRLSLTDCQRLAQDALQMSTAGEVRARLAEFSDELPISGE